MASTINFDMTSEMALLISEHSCRKCGKVYNDPVKMKVCGHLVCAACASSKCAICGVGKGIQGPCNFTAKIVNWIKEMENKYADKSFLINNIPKINGTDSDIVIPATQNPQQVHIIKTAMKRNSKGESGLHVACKQGKLDKVKQLIESGCDVNAVDWANWTPLHEGVQSNAFDCVRELLNAGALVNAPGENYITPLHQARELQFEKIVDILLEFGADPKSIDFSGNIAMSNGLEVQPTKEQLFVAQIKEALILGVSDDTKKVLTNRTIVCSGKFNVKKTDVIIYGKADNLQKHTSLMAILNGIPLVNERNVESLFSPDFPLNLNFPEELSAPLKDCIMNKLYRKPRLFDGMKFHVINSLKKVSRHNFVLNRCQICEMIEAGGGKLLVRPPAERTVDSADVQYPYHAKGSKKLKSCLNYIVYDARNAPLLLYRMSELRHVPADWIVDCTLAFKIIEMDGF
ncbi:PREDICTED: BRCA1-associated RING domain protein 1-like [Nicrophorus vespilloides]|uniref:BRCA1-associated RING domain protein 1-like n=1 Tax=Nicrophorus vespilloides TaxID=110193 RepID=A0ABM1M3M8_NICVS|nr:PREDICTED: BRCA1-associated RING domain protein 1-like [Nicrophorus vespilloides]